MIQDFPLLRQPGDKSCLPTAVRAVLLWHGQSVTRSQISAWCGEDSNGCWIDSALEGLRFEGFDIEEISRNKEAVILIVNDADDPHPIIMLTQNLIAVNINHAVVLLGIETGIDGGEIAFYLDPLTGAVEQDTAEEFWMNWTFAGERAFVLRP